MPVFKTSRAVLVKGEHPDVSENFYGIRARSIQIHERQFGCWDARSDNHAGQGRSAAVLLFSICAKRAIGIRLRLRGGKINSEPGLTAFKTEMAVKARILKLPSGCRSDKAVRHSTSWITVACRVLKVEAMIIEVTDSDLRAFDDNPFFNTRSPIHIYCGPPAID